MMKNYKHFIIFISGLKNGNINLQKLKINLERNTQSNQVNIFKVKFNFKKNFQDQMGDQTFWWKQSTVIENNIENNFKNNIESVLIDIKTGSFRHSDELQIKSYLSLINYQEIVKQNGMMYQKQVIQYGMIIYLKDDKVNQENIKLFTYSESMIQEQLDKRNKYLLSNHKSQSQDIEDFFNNLPDPNLEQLESGCSLCHHQFLCSYKNLNSQKSNQSLIELQQRKNIKKYDLTKMSEKSKQYLNIMLKDLTKEEFEHLYLKQFELTVEIQKEGDEYKLELLKLFDEKMLKIFEQFIKSNKILTIALYTETYQFTITKGLQYKQVDNLNKIFIIGKFQTDDFDKARYPFLIQYYNPFYSYKQIIVDLVGVFIQQTNTDSNVFKNKLQLNKLLIQEEKPQIEQQINNIEQNSSKEVQLCLNAKDYVLVQSGEQNKERMLFELLKVLENQKKHVLICVEKPKTLVKLCKHCPNKNILAIPQKNSDELKEINEYLIDYKCQDQQQINDIWNQKYFYFSICDDYSQNKFRFQEFDYCILYEASKILEPLCIICIWTSKKFILFGKSNEKPEVKSNSVSQLKISLFERLSKIAQETGVFIDIDEDHQQMNI
ncbi:unnamed protein product [Paramecium sonneborni]|uniref:Uncharacterized protein n=1 Tax=Paramecium sonneborni TaxID=65129 RepID=A0A8S1PD73_9CILI|nr:unnamed protein product [Paramecium sonneborni]